MNWLLTAIVCLDGLCSEVIAANSVTGPVVFQNESECYSQISRFVLLLTTQMAYEGEIWKIRSIECRPNGEIS
jgi:hypothetical protein